jgi:protein-S-isoprenylcysteine O-methyltransferase Ste14
MNEMLIALGRRPSALQRTLLTVVFLAVIGAILAVGAMISRQSLPLTFAVHATGWFLWFGWLGWILPRSQYRSRQSKDIHAYRTAFWRHILPGISFGVAQMLRPALFGVMAPSIAIAPAWSIAVGFVLGTATLALLIVAFGTLGFAAAGFVYDYQLDKAPVVQSKVYSFIRHPLFFGSVLGALSLTLVFADRSSLYLAFLNVAALPIYCWLEDRRLVLILGDAYHDYRAKVPAFLAIRPWFASRLRPCGSSAAFRLNCDAPIVQANEHAASMISYQSQCLTS